MNTNETSSRSRDDANARLTELHDRLFKAEVIRDQAEEAVMDIKLSILAEEAKLRALPRAPIVITESDRRSQDAQVENIDLAFMRGGKNRNTPAVVEDSDKDKAAS